jgi:16S rRNA processing protein RimM
MDEKFLIAQIGRTVGLYGDLKLNLHTDFTEQFKVGAVFKAKSTNLVIEAYDPRRSLVRFVGYAGIDSAKRLTNTKIYRTQDETRDSCKLDSGEYFWFDIIGSDIYDGEINLGNIVDIDRMLNTDYLVIDTHSQLIEEGMPKSFLLPYIPRYVVDVDLEQKRVYTVDARDILEAS